MKKVFLFSLIGLLSSQLFAFEAIPTKELLLSYLENDSQLQDLTIAVKKAEISQKQSEISNGIDITLSTGTITIQGSDNGTKITAKPSATLSIPKMANLSLSAKTNISPDNRTSDTKISDTSISLSADLISENNTTRKISAKKSERSVWEAKQKLQKRAVSAEREFYNELKSLLNSTNSLIQAENSLYSDKIKFEETKAQGFSTTSSTYKLAEMKVISDEHNMEASKRSLLHDFAVFYMKCGYSAEFEINQDFMELIPTDIVEVEPFNIKSFDSEKYADIEKAMWNYEINSQQRNAKKNIQLSANAGYTIKNSATNSDSVDAGVNGSFGGLGVGGGISFPIDGDKKPSYTVSASITPNTFRKNKLTKQDNELSEQQDLLAITTAQNNYETAVIQSVQSLEDIIWERSTIDENLEMYTKSTEELADWYKQGFITESTYLSAKTNMEQYKVKQLINTINVIIYNDQVLEMFNN